jgi:hypothetical protein
VKFDDIEKLRGCSILAKEDPSVFVTPIFCADDGDDDVDGNELINEGQRLLDRDYSGFAFAPSDLMQQYKSDKSNVTAAGKLFCHMTNFVARNHGWNVGSSLKPSDYLQCEISSDQFDLLNPNARDVTIGAIIDQCTGVAAKKVTAKRRVDFVSGNVNSYARLLNGPQQLDKIQTYNDLAATMAELKRDKDRQQEEKREKKAEEDQAKAARKAEKEASAIARAAELEPVCEMQVNKGIAYVLALNLPEKKDIIRYYFKLASVDIDGVSKAVYKLNSAEVAVVLNRLMPAMPIDGVNAGVVYDGMGENEGEEAMM